MLVQEGMRMFSREPYHGFRIVLTVSCDPEVVHASLAAEGIPECSGTDFTGKSTGGGIISVRPSARIGVPGSSRHKNLPRTFR